MVKHTRKDSVVKFARGNVRYKVANNGYIADVLVAIKKDGSAVLYELVNIIPTKITEPSSYQGRKSPRRHDSSAMEGTIPQQSENSQQKFSLRGDVEETKKLLKNFEIKSINDYIGVQKAIINTLVEESFFSNGNNVIKNKDSGMIIEITKDGIKETFGKDYRFQTLPRQLKVLKLATVRYLPSLIENARLVQDNVHNVHNKKSKLKYAYLVHDITVKSDEGEMDYIVSISVRKSQQKNKFWTHEVRIIKKEQGLSPSGDINPQQGYNKTLVHGDMLYQTGDSVKKKFSGRDSAGNTLSKELNVIKKDYFNSDIDLIFGFSRNNFEESYSKQKSNYIDFAKMLPVFSEIIDSAIGIETHKRTKYKPDATLDNVFVLMSAYQDGEYIIPVKLEVKKFKDKNNSLYVAISLEKIKMTEISEQGDTENGVTQNSNSVNISIAQIFKKINIKDKDFLKYVPDGFLDARQKKVKKEALEEQSRQESLYSDRDTDGGFSQRYLLMNALESTAQTAEDKKRLAEYKSKLGMLSETQDRLHKVNAKIKELSFGKGKRDAEQLANLKRTAKELTDLINRYDKKLFSLESTDSLKRVPEVERKRAYAKATEEGRNNLQAYKDKMIQREQNIRDKYQESRADAVEKRSKTEMKNKIKKLVGKLDSLSCLPLCSS